jgi:hypothetical protein
MPLKEIDCRGRPGSGLYVGQAALETTDEDLSGTSAGRFDQAAAFLKRESPERCEILIQQRGFGIRQCGVFEEI